MSRLRIGSLFTGTGALDMAAREVFGGEVVWTSDIKPAAVRFHEYRHPGVPNIGDLVRMFPAVGPLPREALDLAIEILTAGWPCQPHSSAGKRLGEDDPRALWPNVHRVIAELRPAVFLGENVARIASNGELRRAVRSLAEIGYVGAWRCVTAAEVGAPHKRDRCFVVAVRADVAADPLGGGLGPHIDDVRAGEPHAARRGQLTLLPTPTQSMTTGAGTSGRDGGLNLQTAVTLIPTPRESDAGPRGGTTGHGLRSWSRELVREENPPATWGRYEAAVRRWEAIFGRPAPAPTQLGPKGGFQLAPRFVEWMMGLPEGHVTDVPDLAPRANGHRNAALSMLGDGVVPQQAAHAYRAMFDELLTAERAA